jgi:uncharacterized protein YdbL (DUF1318 family)
MRLRSTLLSALAALALAGAASALDLETAKSAGSIGERTDGYVEAVAPSPADDVKALVQEVNAKRKASYQEIAEKNGTDAGKVAALAAQKLLERAPQGTWIQDGGRWYQKQ